MRLSYLYILLFIMTGCLPAIAQDNPKFISYSVDDGLPQSSVWSILQDKNGFLWVGTADGLCRFDGYQFTVFRTISGDTNSIAGKSNIHLFEDASKNIWIAHEKGITKYNIDENRFINVYKYHALPNWETFNRIMGQDQEGNIWIGVVNGGLFKIDSRTNNIKEIVPSTDTAFKDDVNWFSGFIDEEQRIWFTKRGNGLFCYDIRKHKFEKYLTQYKGAAIVPFGRSGILISSADKLLVFDKEDHSYSFIDQSQASDDLRVKGEINNIVWDQKSHLWLCNVRGVYVLDTAKRKVIRRFSSYSQGTNNYSYSHIAYRDHSGNMWIGTNGDGLKMLVNDTKGFRKYCGPGPGGSVVKCIYPCAPLLYVGCFDNGVDVFNTDTGFIKKLNKKASHEASYIHSVYGAADFNDKFSVIYSAESWRHNLILYNFRTGIAIDLLPQLIREISSDFKGGDQPFLLHTKNGVVFDWDNKLVLLSGSDPKKIHFELIHSFGKEILMCCYEMNNGLLYVGSTTGFYFQTIEGDWVKGALPEQQYVKTICEDKDGNAWVGTTNGIYVFDRQNRLLTHYDVSNGLKNDFIYGILKDNNGRMWFSHNKGISVYDPAKKLFHHYSSEDGLQSNEFNTGAYCKMSNGMMLFGGINGVNMFNPDSVKDNLNMPPVRITGIKVFDLPLKTDTPYWYVHTLTLPYNKNSISFDFNALEFTNPHNNQYAYQMEGLDNGWIQAGTDHKARYPALQPGEYVFKVKAANNDGVWQEVPTIINIVIVPPFWQQWWFRVLCVLVSISIITGVILWIQKQRHKRQIRELELQQKIQLERERISRDLHDNVGTQLSLISNNIEWVTYPLKVISEHEKTEKLQFVNNAARGIIATLRETIWALNKEQISLEEFSDKLKAFVQKQIVLYPQTVLNFSEQINDRVILGPSEALNLFRICQEAIVNALKYAEAGVLDITIQSQDRKYKISIADNGKGFDAHLVDPTVQNGLENMRFRAGDITAALEIISAVNKGTTVIISKK